MTSTPVARDVITGQGLGQILTGVGAVIDVVSWHDSDEKAATAFFRTSARNLHEYGRKAGVARIAMASVIGADIPDAGLAADGAFPPGPHARLAGPTFRDWLDTQP
ncbi:hypothetical protein [Nonomuraea longicatena]|uniref:Uncharacterized protein n=1 Tax=Nonomuraea longicatena TaxID=83682 RepID=A0ABN1Q9W4_9ACTN